VPQIMHYQFHLVGWELHDADGLFFGMEGFLECCFVQSLDRRTEDVSRSVPNAKSHLVARV